MGEGPARRKDRNKHKRQTFSHAPAGFQPRNQTAKTYALHGAATDIGVYIIYRPTNFNLVSLLHPRTTLNYFSITEFFMLHAPTVLFAALHACVDITVLVSFPVPTLQAAYGQVVDAQLMPSSLQKLKSIS